MTRCQIPEIVISAEELGKELVHEGEQVPKMMRIAAENAAHHLVAYLVGLTDELGITDQGIFKNSFHVSTDSSGSSTYNDAPHADIVEEGCRPHFVNKEGIETIASWAKRKLGISDPKEAKSAAFAIAHNISEKGLLGRFIFRDSVDKAKEFFREELERALNR